MTKSCMVTFRSADGLEKTERLTLPFPVPDTYERRYRVLGDFYADEIPAGVEQLETRIRFYRLVEHDARGDRHFVTYRECVPKISENEK